MCGIAGILSFSPETWPVDETTLISMRDTMIHRGPDGAGVWIDEAARIGFGHRRLAIIDLSMPDMNGFELAEAVQRNPNLDELRMILLTAFDQNEGARRALNKGFSAYLTKPVRHSRLLGTIRGVLADVALQTGTSGD